MIAECVFGRVVMVAVLVFSFTVSMSFAVPLR
jgi:hypothetical protein